MTLAELVEELNNLDDAEKLEWLVEYSDQLPPLSPGHASGPAAESCRVQECQTPVYLWVEVAGDRVRLEADVPKKSPAPTLVGFRYACCVHTPALRSKT